MQKCRRCNSAKPIPGKKSCPKCLQADRDNRSRLKALLADAAERAKAQTDPTLHQTSAPAGYRLRGVSTYLDEAGRPRATWVKTARKPDTALSVLTEFRAMLAEDPLPMAPISAPPAHTSADLACVYPVGDPHIGMLSWALETGEDFDLQIAERLMVKAVDHLVSLAPAAETAYLVELGDLYHSDNNQNRTSRSGNVLDVDSRFPKILRVGLHTMVQCVDRLLQKHRTVHVILEIGNHDDHLSIVTGLMLEAYYRADPRVHVDTSPAAYHCHVFGANMIASTHGHTIKPEKFAAVLANDRPEWSSTRHRYAYLGHIHHERKIEVPGLVCESFRTLAARDAWSASTGYRSGRDMNCDVLHVDRGRIARHTVPVEALK